MCKVLLKYFPEIIEDNTIIYLKHLEAIIDSIDELSSLQITKSKDGYLFRLAPSLPKYNNMLIKEILKLHNLYNIHLDLSKSIKTSATINFKINLC